MAEWLQRWAQEPQEDELFQVTPPQWQEYMSIYEQEGELAAQAFLWQLANADTDPNH